MNQLAEKTTAYTHINYWLDLFIFSYFTFYLVPFFFFSRFSFQILFFDYNSR